MKTKTLSASIRTQIANFGIVTSNIDGIISISGLANLKAGELVYVGLHKVTALVLNLEFSQSKAILFGNDSQVDEGDLVKPADALVRVGINSGLLGRVVDGLGNLIDGKEDLKFEEFYNIDVKAPGIIERKSVSQPMPTGIKVIDSMVPIGNGQRELIIGDRQTGKTSIAIDTIINQLNNPLQMICVYVAIGQKKSSVSFLVNKLSEHGSLGYTIFVLAGASDAAAIQFLSPYTGCTIGE